MVNKALNSLLVLPTSGEYADMFSTASSSFLSRFMRRLLILPRAGLVVVQEMGVPTNPKVVDRLRSPLMRTSAFPEVCGFLSVWTFSVSGYFVRTSQTASSSQLIFKHHSLKVNKVSNLIHDLMGPNEGFWQRYDLANPHD